MQSRHTLPGWYGVGSGLFGYSKDKPERIQKLQAMYQVKKTETRLVGRFFIFFCWLDSLGCWYFGWSVGWLVGHSGFCLLELWYLARIREWENTCTKRKNVRVARIRMNISGWLKQYWDVSGTSFFLCAGVAFLPDIPVERAGEFRKFLAHKTGKKVMEEY